MPFRYAIGDLAAKPRGVRRAAAFAWAERMAMVEDRTALKELLRLEAGPHVDVSNYCWTTRAFNVLHANELTDAEDLMECSVPDLWDLRQCGTKTVVDVIQALLTALVRAPEAARSSSPQPSGAALDNTPAPGAAETDARMAAPEPTAHDVPRLISKWTAGLDEREASIVLHRLASRDRTLDDLGQAFGVTRERIRQLESKLVQQLSAQRESHLTAAALHKLDLEIRRTIASVSSVHRIVSDIPELAADLPGLGCQVVDLLPVLLPDIAMESGWVAVRPIADLRDETSAIALSSGDPAGAGRAGTTDEIRQRMGLTADEWPKWLGYCGLRALSGVVVVRAGAGIPELAAAVLRAAGKPMSAESITAALGAESVRSVRNRLLDDPRITRLAPNLYGLPEWKMETYEGIREEIVQRIDRAGGRVRISSVVEELVRQFGVSPNSVQSYASGREFVRKEGWLSLAGDAAVRAGRPSRKVVTPASTRRCFFRDGRWWFRVDVTADGLRGSGFPAPVGAMRLFQVAEGTERIFDADGLQMRISWTRSQPAIGSVRGLLLAQHAGTGDALWITLFGGREIGLRLARAPSGRAQDALAHLTGVEPADDLETLRQRVSEGLGFPEGKTWKGLAQILSGRGDLDAAELIEDTMPDEPEITPTLDEFLSALRGC